MKKTGFTLAEVLMTLGIVGVLILVLMRGVLSARPNEEQIMLKKSYYELSRIVHELINDDDLYPEESADTNKEGQYLANTRAVTYKGVTYGGAADSDEAKAKFCTLFGTRLNLREQHACDAAHEELNDGGHFVTADGIVWSLPITEFVEKSKNDEGEDIVEAVTGTIYIDVNGESGDNCYEDDENCKVPDRFKITIHGDGRIEIPEGCDITEYYISNSNTKKSIAEVREIIKKNKNTTGYSGYNN